MEREPKPTEDQRLARWFIMFGFMVNPSADQINVHDESCVLEIMDKLEVPKPMVTIDTKKQ